MVNYEVALFSSNIPVLLQQLLLLNLELLFQLVDEVLVLSVRDVTKGVRLEESKAFRFELLKMVRDLVFHHWQVVNQVRVDVLLVILYGLLIRVL